MTRVLLIGSLVIMSVGMASCSNVDASEENAVEKSSIYASAKTQADCLNLNLNGKEQIAECMRAVSLRKANEHQKHLEAKEDVLTAVKQEGEELEATIKVLSDVKDTMEKPKPNP